jgi:hypothetical protein
MIEKYGKIGIIFGQLIDIDYQKTKHQILIFKKIIVSFLKVFGNCNKNVKDNHNQQWEKMQLEKKWKNNDDKTNM